MDREDRDQFLTPKEAAVMLGLHETTVLDRLRAGTLPGLKIGFGPKARWRIRLSDLRQSIAAPEKFRWTEESLHQTVEAIREAIAAAGAFETTRGIEAVVRGIDRPAGAWWVLLGQGIRALMAREEP